MSYTNSLGACDAVGIDEASALKTLLDSRLALGNFKNV